MTAKIIDTPTEALANAVTDVKSSFSHIADSLSEALNQRKAAAAEQFDARRAAVVDYARENPMRTVGVAAVIGLALGVLFFRR